MPQKNPKLGIGAICGSAWLFKQWDEQFMIKNNPSIEYLELYGVLAAVLSWIHLFRNKRIILHCDNSSVVEMINSTTSSCKNCMVLIRLLVFKSLIENVRIFARHVSGVKNYLSDSLSRMKIEKFHELAGKDGLCFNNLPTNIPEDLWPMEKIWR